MTPELFNLIKEGGFLVLLCFSAWFNLTQWKKNNEIRDEHAEQMQKLNDATLAATKDFALQIKTVQEKQAGQVISLYERWASVIAKLDPGGDK